MEQLSFGDWLRKKGQTPRLAGWHMYVLGKVTAEKDIRALRKWCKENFIKGVKVKPERILTPIMGHKKCIATTVWIECTDDALLFKLRWSDYE